MDLSRSIHELAIVVIDDHPVNAEAMSKLLSSAGYRNIHVFTNSRTALERFSTLEADLVLLDMHMPEPNGLTLLREFRRMTAGSYLPIVMLTGDSSPLVMEQAFASGATDFLTKPFNVTETLLRVRNMLESRMVHQESVRRTAQLEQQVDDFWATERDLVEHRQRVSRAVAAILETGDGLAIVFQPIVNILSGEVFGVEALSRFSLAPIRAPDEWFHDAASVGLGVQLELAAITRALSHSNELPPGIFISINVSPPTLCSPRLFEILSDQSDRDFVVELTEHDRVEDYQPLTEAIVRLRHIGVRIAIDDTGAGYASLQHLHHLNPDHIKLDRYFVSGIDTDPVRRALAASLVRLSSDINASLIAEGIETRAELDTIREMGISNAQGYYLARPAPAPLDLGVIPAMA